jgi:uncharacterized protein
VTRHAGSAALLVAALFLTWSSDAAAQIAVPALHARVTDLTGTLDANQRGALEAKLRAFEERKGAQVAVLVVPTTEPEDIAGFGIRVAEAWKLGRKGIDDGAILIVAKNDRRMRIEVGYGLEGVLTDAMSRRIIDETIAPRFRAGDFYAGIDAGIEQMMRIIDGEPLPAPDRSWSPGVALGDSLPLLLMMAVIPALFLRRAVGRFGGAVASGVVTGGIAWAITKLLAAAVAVGAIAFAIGLMVGGMIGPRRWTSHRRGGRYGGWGGGWGGGGFGGGGFGGGGFSGGGGGFGGGGASGGW